MKGKKFLVIFLCMLFGSILLTACSASKKDASYPESAGDYDSYTETKADSNGASTGFNTSTNSADGTLDDSGSGDYENDSKQVTNDRKLIRRVSMFVETLEFDDTLDLISGEVSNMGGYVENSEINGNQYKSSGSHYAQLVLRIPSDKVDYFINLVDDNTNVTSQTESTEDITLAYMDTESHVKALEIEHERLLVLLEKADKLEDIITLEDRLSNVRYELERFESTLRSYDNLVEYSTITITINEVVRITPVEKKSAWGRIGSGLKDTFLNISDVFVNFVVWFIINLPYFIIWGGIIFVGVMIALKINKKKKR